jgi:hypothetical protein
VSTVAAPGGAMRNADESIVRLPLLCRLFDERDPSARACWADFGPIQPGVLDRLTGTRARLVVLDLPASRAAGKRWTRPTLPVPGPAAPEPVDTVLCWDLLNFATGAELGELGETLAGLGRPGSRVHALIQYSSKTMPSRPCALSIERDLSMRLLPTPDALEAPRYSPKALEKAMPAMRVESTLLLNNGMQEFLFRIADP